MPIVLGVIEPVADDKLVRDLEPDVGDHYGAHTALGLVEECGDSNASGFALLEDAEQIRQRNAGIHDVFYDEYVGILDGDVEILRQLYFAGTGFPFSVGG